MGGGGDGRGWRGVGSGTGCAESCGARGGGVEEGRAEEKPDGGLAGEGCVTWGQVSPLPLVGGPAEGGCWVRREWVRESEYV